METIASTRAIHAKTATGTRACVWLRTGGIYWESFSIYRWRPFVDIKISSRMHYDVWYFAPSRVNGSRRTTRVKIKINIWNDRNLFAVNRIFTSSLRVSFCRYKRDQSKSNRFRNRKQDPFRKENDAALVIDKQKIISTVMKLSIVKMLSPTVMTLSFFSRKV